MSRDSLAEDFGSSERNASYYCWVICSVVASAVFKFPDVMDTQGQVSILGRNVNYVLIESCPRFTVTFVSTIQ